MPLTVGASKLWNVVLRALLTALHRMLKLYWLVRRPSSKGAHALALTPKGCLILVKLRYARGWRLPGGGTREDERPEDGVLRELREEIGLIAFGDVIRLCELHELSDFKRDLATIFLVRDVSYSPPRWSWEIEDVLEANLHELPGDMSPRAARWIEAALPKMQAQLDKRQ